MNNYETLDRLTPGELAVVDRLDVGGDMRRRFLDLGLIENTVVVPSGHGLSRFEIISSVISAVAGPA